MKKITLSDAQREYEFCLAKGSVTLLDIKMLTEEKLKETKYFLCVPFYIGYMPTNCQIVPDEKKLAPGCSNEIPDFNACCSDISNGKKLNSVRRNPTIELLMDRADEIKKAVSVLQYICFTRAKEAGWHDKPVEDGTRIALMHSELSEALEGLRKDLQDDKLPHRKMVEVELADTIIRILDFAGYRGLDVAGAIIEKILFNVDRPDHKRENRAKDGGKKF